MMKSYINILFICKHNIFRSNVAGAYFKKINKNKSIKSSSAGLIKADILTNAEKVLIKRQRKIAKSFGINLKKSSKNLKISLLNKQDIIVIVADDVPNIFNNKFYLKPSLRIIKWKIPDIKGTKDDNKIILDDIKQIIKRVDLLNKTLGLN